MVETNNSFPKHSLIPSAGAVETFIGSLGRLVPHCISLTSGEQLPEYLKWRLLSLVECHDVLLASLARAEWALGHLWRTSLILSLTQVMNRIPSRDGLLIPPEQALVGGRHLSMLWATCSVLVLLWHAYPPGVVELYFPWSIR